jgi:hypothetical protein
MSRAIVVEKDEIMANCDNEQGRSVASLAQGGSVKAVSLLLHTLANHALLWLYILIMTRYCCVGRIAA